VSGKSIRGHLGLAQMAHSFVTFEGLYSALDCQTPVALVVSVLKGHTTAIGSTLAASTAPHVQRQGGRFPCRPGSVAVTLQIPLSPFIHDRWKCDPVKPRRRSLSVEPQVKEGILCQ
jgi:hypothetical protein